jgi:hypothetical protein
MDLDDHPGNLGSVGGTLLTILHADWPAYPEGNGPDFALFHLTAFPPDTEFLEVDDIDQCMLFMADVPGSDKENKFNERNFHVAVWHEDLLESCKHGWITGVAPTSEWGWKEAQWKKLKTQFPNGFYHSGQKYQLEPPNPEENYLDDLPSYAILPNGKIKITVEGRNQVQKTIAAQNLDVAADVSPKVAKLLSIGYFDTCLREACVQLEHEVKQFLKTDEFGNKLVERLADHIGKSKKYLESFRRTYRQEMRSIFKIIRNNYMHNLVDADLAQAEVMLFRIARARSFLKDLTRDIATITTK